MNFEQSFISMSSETQVLHAFADRDGDDQKEILYGGIVGSGISRAANMTGDGIDDLVVNNAEGAYALLSN